MTSRTKAPKGEQLVFPIKVPKHAPTYKARLAPL